MAKDSFPGVSEDSKLLLEDQVKRGKARKFFLICKGANIRTLVVFKKGPFGPKVTQAKKDGAKGEVTYGVVSGAGQRLHFQLAGNDEVAKAMKVDGFCETVPCKTAKLREFLNDNGMKFKPSYYILVDPATAPDPDSDSDAPPPPENCEVGGEDQRPEQAITSESPAAELPPEQTAATDPPIVGSAQSESPPEPVAAAPSSKHDEAEPPPSQVAPEPEVDEFTELSARREALEQQFETLQPQLHAVTAAYPDEKEDLEDLADEFRQSMQINDLDVAAEWLEKLSEALSTLPTPSPSSDSRETEFETRLKQVLPRAAPIAKAGGPQGESLMNLLQTAKGQRAAGDYINGLATIAQIETALQQQAEPDNNAAQEEFESLLKQYAGPGVAVVKSKGPNADEIGALLKEVQTDRNASNFAAGSEKLRRVGELLAVPTPAADSAPAEADVKDDVSQQWRERYEALEKGVQQVVDEKRENWTKISAAYAMSAEKADSGDLETAMKLLDRLELAVEKALGAPTELDVIPEGIVRKRRFLIERWRQCKAEIQDEVERLVAALEAIVPERTPSQLADAITGELSQFYGDLNEALDAAVNATLEQATEKELAVKDLIGAYRSRVVADPLWQHLEVNTADPNLQFVPVLTSTLDELEHTLST